jgi:hypothetical protein
MPADMGGKSPLRDGSNEESILAKIKQISSLLQFKTCAPALRDPLIFYFSMPLNDLFDDIAHQIPAYRLY